jgi:hypothetical protein
LIDGLKKKWKYNENMANRFLKCGYDRTYTFKVMEQLSAHYNIETIYERCYFKELEWKILIPESNLEARKISLHSYSILKDQVLMN